MLQKWLEKFYGHFNSSFWREALSLLESVQPTAVTPGCVQLLSSLSKLKTLQSHLSGPQGVSV